jgi:peptidoglycan/LPS O-acetylase OafA/YrhL
MDLANVQKNTAQTIKKIELIDFLKGFSIFTIVWMHYLMNVSLPAIIAKLIPFGGTGIHVFLFVSGFGLYLANSKKALPYWQFIKKRFLKIYIPVTLTVLLIFIISIFIPIYPLSLYALMGHILLYKMFDESIIGSYGYQFWFVSTIIQLYVVFPLIIKLEQKMNIKKLVFIAFAISICWSSTVLLLGKADLRVWNSFFLQFLWEFVLGMFVANQYIFHGFRFENIIWLVLLGLTVLGLILFFALATQIGVVGKMLDDLPALVGYLGLAVVIYRVNIKIINQFFLKIGDLSFQFYLLHFCFMSIAILGSKKFGYDFNIICCIILFCFTYLIALVTNRLINKLYTVLPL